MLQWPKYDPKSVMFCLCNYLICVFRHNDAFVGGKGWEKMERKRNQWKREKKEVKGEKCHRCH